MTNEHADARLFVVSGPWFDSYGTRRREWDNTHGVVRELRVGRGRRYETIAACTSAKAANAARRLLSGECEVRP